MLFIDIMTLLISYKMSYDTLNENVTYSFPVKADVGTS